jgi:hypothetical protein
MACIALNVPDSNTFRSFQQPRQTPDLRHETLVPDKSKSPSDDFAKMHVPSSRRTGGSKTSRKLLQPSQTLAISYVTLVMERSKRPSDDFAKQP